MSKPFLALAFLAFCASAPAFAQAPADPAKVLARVNGEAVTEADVALAIEDLSTQYPNMPAEQQRKIAVDFLIEVKLAAQAGAKEKMDATEDFKRKLAYARERILMERLLAREGGKASSEAAVKAYYDEQVKQLKPVEELRARHILVETEEAGKAIAERLKKGEDFAAVAKEVSKDPGSGQNGGDLGFFTKEQMVPEFAEAAYALKPGEISAPVKSQFGWHVIRAEERRTRAAPALDTVRDRLAQALANKAQGEYLLKLREAAKIERLDGPAEPKKN